jgi:tetratricopeptide (TPR) repeat protein
MRLIVVTTTTALVCLLSVAQTGCGASVDTQNSSDASATPVVAESSPTANNERTPPEQTLHASDAQGFFQKGVEAYKKNRDAEAVEAFREAIRLEPDFAEAHYRLGLAQSVAGEKEEAKKSFEWAVRAYQKVLRENPKDAEAHFNLGLVYGRLFKPEEAVKELKEAVRHKTDDRNMYYELGLAHTKLAQYREAVAALNKALELDPDDYRASDALEKAKAGVERREAFLKQQEKMAQKEKQKANANQNKNGNTNTNTNTRANTNVNVST